MKFISTEFMEKDIPLSCDTNKILRLNIRNYCSQWLTRAFILWHIKFYKSLRDGFIQYLNDNQNPSPWRKKYYYLEKANVNYCWTHTLNYFSDWERSYCCRKRKKHCIHFGLLKFLAALIRRTAMLAPVYGQFSVQVFVNHPVGLPGMFLISDTVIEQLF